MAKNSDERYPMLVKVAGTVAALGAAWLAQKAVNAAWHASTGRDLPTERDSDNEALTHVLVASAVSGAVMAAVRVAAMRGGTRMARRIVRKD